MALDALGVEDAADLTSDEVLIPEEEEEPEPAPMPPMMVPAQPMPTGQAEPEPPEPTEESGIDIVARMIAENFRAGKIDNTQVVEWAIGIGYDAGLEQ